MDVSSSDSSKIDTYKYTFRHMVAKLQNTKDKEKVLNTAEVGAHKVACKNQCALKKILNRWDDREEEEGGGVFLKDKCVDKPVKINYVEY